MVSENNFIEIESNNFPQLIGIVMIDELFKKSIVNHKKQWYGVGCYWSLQGKIDMVCHSNDFHWKSVIKNILLQFCWFVLKDDRERNHWQGDAIDTSGNSNNILIWNEIQLVLDKAIDVEWYS